VRYSHARAAALNSETLTFETRDETFAWRSRDVTETLKCRSKPVNVVTVTTVTACLLVFTVYSGLLCF